MAKPMRSLLSRNFTALWLVAFGIGLVSAPVSSLFPVYVEDELHRSPMFTGALRSLMMLMGGLMALPGGAMSDTLGRKPTYLLGLTTAITSGLVFLTHRPGLLVGLCLYTGMTMGLQSAAGQTYLMDAVPSSVLGLATAGYFLGATLGNAMGNFIFGPLIDAASFGLAGRWITAGAAVVIVGGALFMPSLPRAAAAPPRLTLGSLMDYRGILGRPEVLLLVGLRYLPTAFWGVHNLCIPLLIFRLTGSKATVAQYTGAYLLLAAVCQIVTGRLCDRYGRKWPVWIASTLVTLSAVGLASTPHHLGGLYAFGMLGAAAAWSLSTTMPGLVNERAGAAEKGRVLGVTHLAWSFGMLSGSLGGGKLVNLNPALPFLITAVGCAVAVVLGIGLFRIPLRGEQSP
jgi:MFS family permease